MARTFPEVAVPIRQFVIASCVCLTGLTAHAASPGTPSPEIRRMVSEVSAARIEATIHKLVGFGTRNSLSDTKSATRGIGAARNWIRAEFERCSKESGGRLQVALDTHRVESGPRIPKPTDIVNVVATLPGVQPESRERLYVVSGHYDSMPTSPTDPDTAAPGANDDASGTAAVIEMACVMSKYKFDATLVFLAVAGEEQGLLGSKGWADAAKAKGLNVAGMISNDIIGNTKGADGTVIRDRVRLFAEGVPPVKTLPEDVLTLLSTGGENDLPTRQLARLVMASAEQYVPQLKVDLIYRRDRYRRGSDHFSFLDNGYAALRFTEAIEDWRHQHQSPRVEDGVQYGDLPEFVDFAYTANVTRVNTAALAALANSPSAPSDVEMENIRLESDTTLRWKANPEPDVAGYRIVWRDTTVPLWQHAKDVGNVTRDTLVGVSKDNFVFGVQAYDRDGQLGVVTYPRPYFR